jgi:hypothetical protein
MRRITPVFGIRILGTFMGLLWVIWGVSAGDWATKLKNARKSRMDSRAIRRQENARLGNEWMKP